MSRRRSSALQRRRRPRRNGAALRTAIGRGSQVVAADCAQVRVDLFVANIAIDFGDGRKQHQENDRKNHNISVIRTQTSVVAAQRIDQEIKAQPEESEPPEISRFLVLVAAVKAQPENDVYRAD